MCIDKSFSFTVNWNKTETLDTLFLKHNYEMQAVFFIPLFL